MWSTVSGSTPSILAALAMAGVGSNVFQTVNKAAVAQHAPPELVGTVMGMSGTSAVFLGSAVRDMSVSVAFLLNCACCVRLPCTTVLVAFVFNGVF